MACEPILFCIHVHIPYHHHHHHHHKFSHIVAQPHWFCQIWFLQFYDKNRLKKTNIKTLYMWLHCITTVSCPYKGNSMVTRITFFRFWPSLNVIIYICTWMYMYISFVIFFHSSCTVPRSYSAQNKNFINLLHMYMYVHVHVRVHKRKSNILFICLKHTCTYIKFMKLLFVCAEWSLGLT